MPATTDRLVWIDCEMTGLDLAVDELVEVAVVVTDFDLTPVHDGFSIVIKPGRSAWNGMGDFVRAMHAESGLADEVPDGVSLADAEYAVLEYILEHVPTAQHAPLAGNTIGTDRAFKDEEIAAGEFGACADAKIVELPLYPVFVGIELVLNLAENLLDHVLHAHDTRRTAKLIDHQRQAFSFR